MKFSTTKILIIVITIIVLGIAIYCWMSSKKNTVENYDKYAEYCGNFKSRGDCRKQNHCAWINYGSDTSKFGSYCTSQESLPEVSEEEEEMIQQRVQMKAEENISEEVMSKGSYTPDQYSFEGL